MKVAIIGAGAAGLCATKHCLDEQLQVDVFEQTGKVGGTWNYSHRVGVDEHGLPVHSSMYQGLYTNLPKELMAFEGFPYEDQAQSYLPSEKVLNYINSYAEKFQLTKHIKFYTHVLKINPEAHHNSNWSVEFEDIKTKTRTINYYNAILVCNGHFSKPFQPEIEGLESFEGTACHSHDYRHNAEYQGKRVVVVGAGPSGLDIAHQIQQVAKEVYLSQKEESSNVSPSTSTITNSGLIRKPIISRINKNSIWFDDGSHVDAIDSILFCTGYHYDFPFLSEACGIQVIDNRVHPLYQHIININNPSMAFIGLPFRSCPFPMYGAQIRFFLAIFLHRSKISKGEMLADLEQQLQSKSNCIRKFHELGNGQGEYFDKLADIAGIKRVPSAIHKLFCRVGMNRNVRDSFRIIDDDNWEQIS